MHQTLCVLKILKKFGLLDCKSASVSLGNHFILSKDQSTANKEEKDFMNEVSYSNVIGFVMYLIVCTTPGLAFTVNILNV